MDTLDIYELPEDTRVIVTIEELRQLYRAGCVDGSTNEFREPPTIEGDIV